MRINNIAARSRRASPRKKRLYEQHITSAPTQPNGSLLLRVLTFNLNGLPLPGVDRTRYRDVGRALKERRAKREAPQIVAFQELFDSKTTEAISEAGYPFVVRGPGPSGMRMGSGIAILSEYPIIQSDSIVFSQCVSWDCFSRKGALFARIQLPGVPHPLEFFTTHLNSEPDTTVGLTPEETQAVRLTQVQELREFMWDKKNSQAPSIFPGDFNFNPHMYDYLSFVSFSMMSNAVELCSIPGNCVGDSDGEQVWKESLDHQFFISGTNPQVRVEPTSFERTFKEKVNGRRLSDHLGLEIVYSVNW